MLLMLDEKGDVFGTLFTKGDKQRHVAAMASYRPCTARSLGSVLKRDVDFALGFAHGQHGAVLGIVRHQFQEALCHVFHA